MNLDDLNEALGFVEAPTDLASRTGMRGVAFTQTCAPDNILSCTYTVNCGSASGSSCSCHGC